MTVQSVIALAAVLLAAAYLARTVLPKKRKARSSGCGCGTDDCAKAPPTPRP